MSGTTSNPHPSGRGGSQSLQLGTVIGSVGDGLTAILNVPV